MPLATISTRATDRASHPLTCADKVLLKELAKTTPASDHNLTLAPRQQATRMSLRATTSTHANVSSSEIESAYEVFKAAATEQQFKSDLNNHFTERFLKEQKHEADALAKSEFDARAPMVELQKAVLALNEQIDNVSSGSSTIAKSANATNVTIPETADLANMSWDDVHRLANKALKEVNTDGTKLCKNSSRHGTLLRWSIPNRLYLRKR